MRYSLKLQAIKTVVCGISGGVDSAVSALLLKRKGYEVVGLFMKNWDSANEKGECQADKDREDAQLVCEHIGIPLHEVNFVKEYWNEVFTSFIKDLQRGWTPNPDVLCNKYIKFDALHNHAINKLGADAIATGHYARTSVGEAIDLVDETKGVNLLQAVDKLKCQTLFLSQISQKALQRAIFPIGDITKDVVKQIARDAGLEKISQKRESMGICFIGKRDFHDFIEDYMEPKPGNFIHIETGETMGKHKAKRDFHDFIEDYMEAKPGNFIHIETREIMGKHKGTVSLFHDFIEDYMEQKRGNFIHIETGETMGKRKGLHYWTIGQRAHLTGGQIAFFVAKKDAQTNNIIVAPGTDHPSLFFDTVFIQPAHWINGPPQELCQGETCEVDFKFQHVHLPMVKCELTLFGANGLMVSLEHPMRALTPGQCAVFYQGDVCLGSAKIIKQGLSLYEQNVREPVKIPAGLT